MWRDEAHLLDMLLYARKAMAFNAEVSLEQFMGDEKLQFATQRAIQVIGEAASKVSPECRNQLTDVPWPQIIGLRHRLVHDYPRIELGRIWKIAKNEIPVLENILAAYLRTDLD